MAPNGQAIILVGPYCAGGNCDDTGETNYEVYSPTFYPASTGAAYPVWDNNTSIPQGAGNFQPNGSSEIKVFFFHKWNFWKIILSKNVPLIIYICFKVLS